MNEFCRHVGSRIRLYRKSKRMSLDQLAQALNKSKSTVSKYETGNIMMHLDTLQEIADILEVNVSQLVDYMPNAGNSDKSLPAYPKNRLFAQQYVYMYFLYNGNVFENVIEASRDPESDNAVMYSGIVPGEEKEDCQNLYYGKIKHLDTFSHLYLQNQFNSVEDLSIYIRNPLGRTKYYSGLLFSLTDDSLTPACLKVIACAERETDMTLLRQLLVIDRDDIKEIRKRNALYCK